MDEHTLNDLLECSVCLERLDTSSKVLPCQHTFCRKCLEVIVSSRQELRCPECRILVDIKIDDLPPNVLLMRILEGMKNAAAKSQQSHHQHQQQQQQYQQFKQPAMPTESNIELQKLNEKLQQQQMKLQLLQKKLLHDQQKQKQQQHQQIAAQQQQQPATQHQQQNTTQPNQQQHPHAALNPPLTANSAPSANASIIQQQPLQSPNTNSAPSGRRCLLPHAYALYDFDSSEPSDLCFKKGDLLLLKRKIDSNWYVGQLSNGNNTTAEGTFPINHVQVVVPLPTPQCIALYDFKMPPNEEQGCLTFKKGTVIHVMRRVDHNWAEGRIGSTIGIFPIAFVELNAMAKQMLEANYGLASGPPSPTNTTERDQQPQQQPVGQHQARNLPPIPLLDPTTNPTGSESTTSSSGSSGASSNASSKTNSPHSLSTTTTTSTTNTGGGIAGHSCPSSMPNSPNQSLPTSPQHSQQMNTANLSSGSSSVRFRDKREKRHSLNALLSAGGMNAGSTTPALSILQSNRHSAEILSMPSEPPSSNSSAGTTHLWTRNAGQDAAMPQSSAALEQQQAQSTPHGRVNVLKTSVLQQQVPPTLPWGYLALYPYKPRKNDELELKKGCVYIVTERCLDGWFKGKNWQDITGVFPGNYVTPLRTRDQQQLMHQWKYVPLQSSPIAAHNSSSATTAVNATSNNNNNSTLPDLPPRHLSSALHISSVWTKPLGHTVEAFFNRHNSKEKNATKDKVGNSMQKESTAATTSSAVQLMKRLADYATASIQQQALRPIAHYSMDNPSFEDVPQQSSTHKDSNVGPMQPVHVRSGSCPSQLLQSLPHDLAGTTTTTTTMAQINENAHNQQQQQCTNVPQLQQQQHKQQISPHTAYGSQRLKGNKERPQLQNARQSMDSTALRAMFNQAVLQQQQQHLFTKCAQQQQHQTEPQQQHISPSLTANHRKCQSLDAGSIIAAAPSNCGSGAGGGGNTTVASCNVTAAAIAASATTKSMQSTRESRFRCVVPYPPNSDIELELHVGDIIYVQRKQKNGWYKGTHARTNKTGLFPASFVEPDI